ncbi:hypothetical protein Leryth_003614 [Lithospermum erythrorhizon]|nr:hypothetical protein Leryth_003614 [Lithospermum erythrorhizon]
MIKITVASSNYSNPPQFMLITYSIAPTNSIKTAGFKLFGNHAKLLNRTDYLVEFYASGNKLKFDLESLKIGKTLKDLDISRNLVFGKLPKDVAGLRMLNVSHNHLCGQLLATKFTASAFVGNDCLCGSPLPACKA